MGLLMPPACPHWETDLLTRIIRKTAAQGGLVRAPGYVKVMCFITLLTLMAFHVRWHESILGHLLVLIFFPVDFSWFGTRI